MFLTLFKPDIDLMPGGTSGFHTSFKLHNYTLFHDQIRYGGPLCKWGPQSEEYNCDTEAAVKGPLKTHIRL